METKKRKQLAWQLPFLIVLIIGTIYIIKQQRSMPYQHNTGNIFGTVYNITYQSETDLNQEIVAELNKVDNSLSTFNNSSIITRINNNQTVKTDRLFNEVFNMAEEISLQTHGAFDITVAPLVNLWGFGFKQGKNPNKQKIDSLLNIVGYNKVSLKNNTVTKADPRVMLDCSAIAKGYGSDCVARFLKSRGIKNFMIEIGGEVVTCGISEKRMPWKIGVTKPTDDSLQINQELQTVLNVTDKAMATSGNYRNFYYKGGKKYAHTIDPHTGYPVQHSLLSATVLANTCAKADAYATAFMVLGIDEAKKVLNQHPDLMAYFIYSDNNNRLAVWYSPSLKNKIVK
ncbi:ApbE family protein [Prevotella sp. DNF00663]|uniref:FAD:protein FMN transferase n=1 Tax=unclassified Prevotella TaxID=2638335 RepID=UPI0005147B5A|nr:MULTISPECIES: FAD:protein FMN transferase [unclassified Prevotella]KGI61105.1 thiamine biosynthesis protein ApbE [Prevotella sp. S7 MS 2]KXB81476.1 ApbE family protein [Prevotella sp. DNF00663]